MAGTGPEVPPKHIAGDRKRQIQTPRLKAVIGLLGELLTLDTLPPPGTQSWAARRKAEVVATEHGGTLSIDETCERYQLNPEGVLVRRQGSNENGEGRALHLVSVVDRREQALQFRHDRRS